MGAPAEPRITPNGAGSKTAGICNVGDSRRRLDGVAARLGALLLSRFAFLDELDREPPSEPFYVAFADAEEGGAHG